MGFFIALLLLVSLFGVIGSLINLGRIKFAQDTLDMVYEMHRQGMISSVQAKVFLNDLDNPLDFESVRGVRWQLEDIIKEERLNASKPA